MFAFAVAPIMVSSVNASRSTCPCIIRSLGLKTSLWDSSVVVNFERNALKLISHHDTKDDKRKARPSGIQNNHTNFQPSRIDREIGGSRRTATPPGLPKSDSGTPRETPSKTKLTTRSGAKSKSTVSAHASTHLRLNAAFCLACDHHHSRSAVERL